MTASSLEQFGTYCQIKFKFEHFSESVKKAFRVSRKMLTVLVLFMSVLVGQTNGLSRCQGDRRRDHLRKTINNPGVIVSTAKNIDFLPNKKRYFWPTPKFFITFFIHEHKAALVCTDQQW
jgi:hypothetical protein